jgi:hypothetical protein
VLFRVTLRNVGAAALKGVGHGLGPRFYVPDGTRLEGEETLDAEAIRKHGTDREIKGDVWRAPDTDLHFAFGEAGLRLRGWGYLCSLDHGMGVGDLAPGEARSARGAWWLMPPGEQPGDAPESPWEGVRADNPVKPLIVPELPPDDLPRTPVARDTYCGLCGRSAGDFPLWQAAGIEWARTSFSWATGEPERGKLDFEAMDAKVAAAEQSGIQLIGLIHGNPAWATTDGSSISPPRDLNAWARYVETLTRRYRGRVHVWEIWNEPDIGQFWTGTVDDYVAFLKAAHRGAKRGNPDCLVMSAGLDGPGERYLMEMIERGAMDYCDLVGFHPYASTPAKAEERMRSVWRILNYHKIRKPVWVTEIGWQSGGWQGGPGVVDSEETKAANLAEMYRRLRPLAEVVCWYVDREAGDMYGLVRPRDGGLVLNPAYHRYREVTGAAEQAGWQLSGPETIASEAGKTASFRWQVRNLTENNLELRARLYEPLDWAKLGVPHASVPPKGTATVELSLSPPPYAVPGDIPCALVAWTPEGPATVAEFTLHLTNDGDTYAVEIERRWAIRLSEQGEQVGKWTPTGKLATPPGERVRQAARVFNRGSATETYRLTLDGPAAAWVPGFPRNVESKGKGEAWLSLDVSVPEDAEQGSYPLILRATSSTYPEVRDSMEYRVRVAAE